MFRNFYDKFAPGYIFLYSVLIAISLVLIKKKYPKKHQWINYLIFFIIILNFFPVKSTVNSPLWQTDNIYRTINIPKEYLDFMHAIKNKIPSTNNILSIPFGTASYTVIKEENSNNSYVGTSPVKIFSGVNDISGDFSFNFTKDLNVIDNAIIDRRYEDLNKFLYNYNINFVLVTKNVPSQVLNSYIYFGPTVAKQDSTFLKAITDKKILISDKGNYELYTTKRKNSLLQSDNLYFQKINSVEYKLYIKNLEGNQELKFNDSFHPGWKLYLKQNHNPSLCTVENFDVSTKTTECKSKFSFFDLSDMFYLWSKPIFDSSHATIDGSSNTWQIDSTYIKDNYAKSYYSVNKNGSINTQLILYFRPQVYFYYGSVVSVIIIVLSTVYLIIRLRKKNEKIK